MADPQGTLPEGFTVDAPAAGTSDPASMLPPGFTLGQGNAVASASRGPMGRPIIDDPQFGASNLANVRASLAVDPQTQIKRYADHFGVPEDHFGVINGEIVRWLPDQNAYAKVVPTVSGQPDLASKASAFVSQTASGFGPALPTAAGTAAGFMAPPSPVSIPTVSAVAAVTDVLRQYADRGLAGENPFGLPASGYLNAVGHGIENGVGQAFGLGVNRMLTTNPIGIAAYDRLAALDPTTRQGVADAYADAKARGIDLSLGQSSGLPSLMTKERQLGRYPETQDQLFAFTKNQRDVQVPGAFSAELGQISPTGGRVAQIGQFRDGAQGIVDAALDARSQQARTAYSTALDGKAPFWSPEVATLMQRPSMKTAWGEAQKLAGEEGVTLPQIFKTAPDGSLTLDTKVVPDWRSWDYIKRGLDSVVEANTNDLGRVNSIGRAVSNTRGDLLKALDAANPDYAAARGLYGSASDKVKMVLDGGVGTLQKMAGADRQNMVETIFGGGKLLPEQVRDMRQLYLVSGKLDDWNAGLRGFLENHLDTAMKTSGTGERGNVPGKLFNDLWGDPRQKAVLEEAFGTGQRLDSFKQLMDVLNRAAKVLPEGSPTATDAGANASGVGTGIKVAGKLFSGSSYLNIGNEIVDGINALRTPEARRQFLDYALSGKGIDEMQKFRMLPQWGQKTIDAASTFLTNAGVVAGGSAIGVRQPSDFVPPASRR